MCSNIFFTLGTGHRGANTVQLGSRTGCEGAGNRPAGRRCPETPGQPHQAAGELQQPNLTAGAAADRQKQHTQSKARFCAQQLSKAITDVPILGFTDVSFLWF